MIAFGLLRRNVVKGWISVGKLVVNCLSSFPSAYPHVPQEIHALSTWSPPLLSFHQ